MALPISQASYLPEERDGAPASTAGADDGGQARPLPPLAVSGLVVTKAAPLAPLWLCVPRSPWAG
jgi:hypothetical protein